MAGGITTTGSDVELNNSKDNSGRASICSWERGVRKGHDKNPPMLRTNQIKVAETRLMKMDKRIGYCVCGDATLVAASK